MHLRGLRRLLVTIQDVGLCDIGLEFYGAYRLQFMICICLTMLSCSEVRRTAKKAKDEPEDAARFRV